MKRKFALLLTAAILATAPVASVCASETGETLIVEEVADFEIVADESDSSDESSAPIQSSEAGEAGIADDVGATDEVNIMDEAGAIDEDDAEDPTILSIEEASEVPEVIVAGNEAEEAAFAENLATEDVAAGIADVTEVRVSTEEELVAAIVSNTKIVLADGTYIYDSPLYIRNVSNLTIVAENTGCAEILATIEYEPVVSIYYSEDISITGVIMGHITDVWCDAPVLSAAYSTGITITDCDLYGCGEVGVQLSSTTAFVADNCVIRDCSMSIAQFYGSVGTFTNCIMSGNGYSAYEALSFWGTSNITFSDCTFINNKNGSLRNDDSYGTFTNCIFEDNAWDGASTSAYGVCLNGITWRVANQILYLGEDITCDGGTVLSGGSGEVLPYSEYSIPWKDYTVKKVVLSDDVTWTDCVYTVLKDLSAYTVTLPNMGSFVYSTDYIRENLSVSNGSSTLVFLTDYTLSYNITRNTSTNTVTGTITVNGINSYTGTISFDFTALLSVEAETEPSTESSSGSADTTVTLAKGKITSLTNTSSGIQIQWNAVSGADGYYIYRKTSGGKYSRIKTITSASKVSYVDKKVVDNNGTTYTYKVVPYSGSTKGSGTAKTTVCLTGTTLTSLKNSAASKAKVKWTAVSGVAGYQIQYSTSKTFASGNGRKTISGATKTSKNLTKLTKGTTYYVRIRTYKTVNGTTYYSAWSSKTKVKITK